MNITCHCGVSVDHASPGCAEHASREAAEIHRAHVASGGSAEHCPVCAAPAAANRSERRQGMGAELERLTRELAHLSRQYLALARNMDARGFELRSAKLDAHTARREVSALTEAVRRERNARAEWLDSLPDGSCGNPPPQALLDAEATTGEVLRAVDGSDASAREAIVWGLMPNLAAVEAHAATQATPHRGAPWMRRHTDSSGDFVDIFYLRVDRGRVVWRGPSGAVWYPASGLMLTSQWRPVTSDGTAARLVVEGVAS